MQVRPGSRLILSLTIVMVTTPIAAQVPSWVVQGARVRITPADKARSRFVATYLNSDSTSLQVRPAAGAGPERYEFNEIGRLEVSRERHSQLGKGALIGGACGAGFGALIGATGADIATSDPDRAANVAGGLLVFTPVGLGIGALVGAVTHADVWEIVPLVRPPERQAVSLRFSVGRAHGRAWIGGQLRW